jgi:hypothetical protein
MIASLGPKGPGRPGGGRARGRGAGRPGPADKPDHSIITAFGRRVKSLRGAIRGGFSRTPAPWRLQVRAGGGLLSGTRARSAGGPPVSGPRGRRRLKGPRRPPAMDGGSFQHAGRRISGASGPGPNAARPSSGGLAGTSARIWARARPMPPAFRIWGARRGRRPGPPASRPGLGHRPETSAGAASGRAAYLFQGAAEGDDSAAASTPGRVKEGPDSEDGPARRHLQEGSAGDGRGAEAPLRHQPRPGSRRHLRRAWEKPASKWLRFHATLKPSSEAVLMGGGKGGGGFGGAAGRRSSRICRRPDTPAATEARHQDRDSHGRGKAPRSLVKGNRINRSMDEKVA